MNKRNEPAATVVVIGPLPPPVHGQSKNTKIMAEDLAGRCDLRVADISAGSLERDLSYQLRKLTRAVRASFTILRASRSPRRRLYIATDGGPGLLYNLLYVVLGRVLGFQIFLHHRSFSFIDRRSRLMAAVAAVAGRRAEHIFLCPAMAERYQGQYASAIRSRVVSNAMHVEVPTELPTVRAEGSGEWLRIGLLSNLGPEKGLDDFLGLLRSAADAGLPIQGILAGPPSSPANATRISMAQSELGERLDYRGALYGDAKRSFFQEIDIFVFPTRYPVEAQPNVLFEAMSHGVPVISYGRGCVATELDRSGMVVVPVEEEFVDLVLPRLRALLEDRSVLADLSQAALDLVRELAVEAQDQYDMLLEALTRRDSTAPREERATRVKHSRG